VNAATESTVAEGWSAGDEIASSRTDTELATETTTSLALKVARPPGLVPGSVKPADAPRSDALRLADELLAAAERSSNPAALIAAARALVAEASDRTSGGRLVKPDGGAQAG
jgi:hypothetical protein